VQKLTGLERMLKAISLQEPDVVPTCETLHHQKVRDGILPGASYEYFIEFMDIDGIMLIDKTTTWSYESLNASKKIVRDQWGGIVRFTSEDLGHPIEPALKSARDIDTYVPPDPDLSWRYEKLEEWVKRFKGEKAIIAQVTDVVTLAKDSFLGDAEYFKGMLRNPDLIDRVHEIVLNYILRYLKNCLDTGADMVFIGGDWAFAQGPMVSPALTKRFMIPTFQRIIEYCHIRGIPCLKHTDGNIWTIFDLMIEAGVDAIHPIDPEAGMDIGDVKAKYGDRVCLMGNIDCGRVLVWGSEEEVREEVRSCIQKAGTGGGLVCTSSNSIHSAVKPNNYIAMIKAIKEYGQYPLHFD